MSTKPLSEMVMDQAQAVGAARHELSKSETALKEKAAALQDDLDNEELQTSVKALTDVVTEQQSAVAKAEARLNTLRDLEKINGERAKEAGAVAGAPAYIKQLKRDPDKPTTLIFKSAAVEFLSYVLRRNPEEILAKHFGDDAAVRAVHGMVQKAAVPIADTTTATWAAELVQQGMAALLESLTSVSVGAALTRYATVLNFGGNASLKVPRVENRTAAGPGMAWVGESGQIPLGRFSFGSETINRYKIASITPCSDELARDAVTNIVALFEREMSKDYAMKLDASLLSNVAAVTGVHPAGLLQGYTAIPGTSGSGIDAVIGDITAMATALSDKNMGERPVLILSKADLIGASAMTSPLGQFQFADAIATGTLMGYPVIASNHVPKHTAVLLDAASLALAFDGPEFMVSREATVVSADAGAAAPTHAGDAANGGALGTAGQVIPDGGIPVAGGSGAANAGSWAFSAFQNYSTLVRGIWPTSWARLRGDMLAHSVTTTWTA